MYNSDVVSHDQPLDCKTNRNDANDNQTSLTNRTNRSLDFDRPRSRSPGGRDTALCGDSRRPSRVAMFFSFMQCITTF